MRIIEVEVENFASYDKLSFKFDAQGLCLIQGPNGSGKSTLCDLTPWILFGITSKNGNADDIRSWNSSDATKGRIIIDLQGIPVEINRQRGKSNDLYYSIGSVYGEGPDVRGKDLNDTQKQINELLGMDAETYLAGAYFHEFSKTAMFFNTNAKTRRLISEQLVDLSLPMTLQENISENKKLLKDSITKTKFSIERHKNSIDLLEDTIKQTELNIEKYQNQSLKRIKELSRLSLNFDKDQAAKILELETLFNEFEAKRPIVSYSDIEHLQTEISLLEAKQHDDEVCKECGSTKHNDERRFLDEKKQQLNYLKKDIESIVREINKPNPYAKQLEIQRNCKNTFTEELENMQNIEHPYIDDLARYNDKLEYELSVLNDNRAILADLQTDQSDIEILGDITDILRARLITDTINFIQDKTNELLSNYFDAEIKVMFEVEDADKLEVTIFKDGNQCVYAQLSKGQRQLLKLCFGVSVMKTVSLHKGLNFNCIFFDEALTGLDENFNIKSYRLFESLALDYSSVFIVDHASEIKSLFNKKYTTSINHGVSSIEEA